MFGTGRIEQACRMTSATPFPPPSTEPSPAPLSRPQLRRSGTESMLGGVCGGLAEHTGIDSTVWRVGFVALTLAGGAGVVAYLLLWVLMPPGRRPADQQPGRLDRLADQAHEKVYATGWLPPKP
jgi:phage shock protein PspC (stress-responsive transcriptional regulator)